MKIRAQAEKTIDESRPGAAFGAPLASSFVCLSLIFAALLGAAIVGAAGGSAAQTLAFGLLVLMLVGALAGLILELPLLALARFAFIGSFFFKGELNFYKIDEIEDPSGFNVSLTLIFALVLLIHDRFDGSDESLGKLFPTSFSILLAALFFCAATSVVYGGATALGWFSLWSFAASIAIAAAVASHFGRRERLTELVVGLAAGILFTGATAVSQYVLDFPTNAAFFGTGTEEEMLGTQSELLSRVPAFLRTPTEMAWVVSALIPLVVAPLVCRAKDFKAPQKWILAAGAMFGVVAVIFSLARGSWVALPVSIGLIVSFGWLKLSVAERKKYLISGGGLLILSGLVLAPFAERIYERLTEDDQGSALIRVPLMETAGRMIEDNALVGVGLNGYRANMTKYDETDIFVSQVFPNPVHNVFAHVTAEIGVPGGIIFVLLFLAALFECFKAMTARDRLLFALALGAVAGLLAFVVSAMKEPGSLGSVRPPLRTLFFVFGMIMAIGRMRRALSVLEKMQFQVPRRNARVRT